MRSPRFALLASLLIVAACDGSDTESSTTAATTLAGSNTSDATGSDATGSEAGTSSSAETTSSSTSSSEPEATTGSATSTGQNDSTSEGDSGNHSGFGEVSGACGLIDTVELTSAEPHIIRNAIDFGTAGLDEALLSDGGLEIIEDGNLNPNSLLSEVVSYEVLAYCEMAALLKTEAEVQYIDPMGKKTDLVVAIDGLTTGVSVTRAYGYPPDAPYTVEHADTLLRDKLSGVLLATQNVGEADAWTKQILHVIAYEDEHADSMEAAWAALEDELRADTILLLTVTHGNDNFIYE